MYGRLAQLVERFIYTEDVGGSSPPSPTQKENRAFGAVFLRLELVFRI